MKVRKAKQESIDEGKFDASIKVGILDFDYLIGQIFGHAELLGLTDRQLQAYRKSLREKFWTWYNNHMANEHGFSDPSLQARIEAGIEAKTTITTTGTILNGYEQFNNR